MKLRLCDSVHIFTEWEGRWCPWHGAVGQLVWQSAAGAAHLLSPEEPRSAGPSGSLATPWKKTSRAELCLAFGILQAVSLIA